MGLFDKIKQKKISPKTVVIGLDGVPYSELLTTLIKDGHLKNMASLFRQGVFRAHGGMHPGDIIGFLDFVHDR